MWVSNSSTLIYGERDAVLVDTFDDRPIAGVAEFGHRKWQESYRDLPDAWQFLRSSGPQRTVYVRKY
jgi:hypothetical protein